MGRAQVSSFLLLATAVTALAAPAWVPPPPLANVMVWISASTLRVRYGIEVERVGVLAAGRLVELRFRVLHPEKARQLFALGPVLRAQSGVLLGAGEAWRRAHPKADGSCSVFFPNVGAEIESGSRVSLAIGAQQLEPVVAK